MPQALGARSDELVRGALMTTLVVCGALATLALVPLAALLRVDQIYSERAELEASLESTNTLSRAVDEHRRLLLAYGTGQDPQLLDQLRQAGRTTGFAIGELGRDDAIAVQATTVAHIQELVDSESETVEGELVAAVAAGDVAAVNAALDEANELLDQIEASTLVLGSAVKVQAREVDEELSAVLGRTRTSMLFSSALTLAVTATAGWINVRAVVGRSEQRFSQLVQHASDMLITVDRVGRITYVSPSVTSVLGHDAEELLSLRLIDLVHPDDRRHVVAVVTGDETKARPGRRACNLRLRTVANGWRHGEALVSTLDDGTVVLTIRDVTERLELEAELRRRAVHDPGTGLANTTALREGLAQALTAARRSRRPVTIIGVGLDGLRELRHLDGSARIDAVVKVVANRVQSVSAPGVLLARVADDELAVVWSASPDEVEQVVAALVDQLGQPVVVDGRPVAVRASLGLATSSGEHTPDELMLGVGLAVQQARTDGAGQCVRFDASVQRAAVEHAVLVTELRDAIRNRTLELHFQPILSMTTGRMVGAEALTRWSHPEQGMIPPARFIPLAEASGDIIDLGRWALAEACTQLRRWHELQPGFSVAVNVAVSQLHDPAFVDEAGTAMRVSGADPAGITFEITEASLVSDTVLDNARRLRDLGVSISIDDFGTGYSALSYLGRLPVSGLKIDKSFVDRLGDEPRSRELIGTIIELAHGFDLQTVAEGIETEEQAGILRDLGCQLGQGFLYSRAVPAAEIDAILLERRPVLARSRLTRR